MAPALRQSLDGVRFGLAGAGRVGSSLAHWAVAAGARLEAVAVHRGGAGLARALGARAVPFDRFESAGCDLLLVAVGDPVLDRVAAALARRPQAAVALHTAGSRGAEALSPLAPRGTAAGTLHPLKAFRRPLPDPAAARGTVFAVGGDPAAEALARRLVEAWGGVAVTVPDDRRLLYHLAASLAAGGAVTLVAAAAALAARLGLPPEVAAGYLELARGALAEVDPADPAAAITGPVARGDAATVARQLEALAAADPELVPLAVALGRETLRRLAAARAPGAERAAVAAALAAAVRPKA
jgi:predicted short-subunit dehydrogenase-like oxidoreductase (DUF2520 family)